MGPAFAVVLALVTATLYALSTSVQALEARLQPEATALRASLLARLARRPLWVAGTLAGVLAWPAQAGALALGSVALVQPALGFGLVVLLVLGVTVLGEHVHARDLAGVLAIAAAVGALGWAARDTTGTFTRDGTLGVAFAAAVLVPLPYLLRVTRRAGGLATSLAAGAGWAWVGLATALLDLAVAERHWLVAVAWALGVAATSVGALLAEMTSLQSWPATRAIPVAFAIEMVAPAALSPALTHGAPPHPAAFGVALAVAAAGAFALGGSRAVAKAAEPLTEP